MANELNNISCSICLNEFNKPKIIDCYHTFCESCLDDYAAKAANNNQFACPLCRKEITVPDGGVKDFSANFYITDTPQVHPLQPEEIQQTSLCMCTLHLREKELFCCNCCEAICIKCFISGHSGHSLETVHDVEKKLIRKLTQLREDFQANVLKDQETLASLTVVIRNKTKIEKQSLKKEVSRACLSKRMERNEAFERRISTVLENHNLCEMLDEISKFGLILVSAKNVDVVSRPIADTNCGELLTDDKEKHAIESDELDERGDQYSLFRLRGEDNPNVRPEEDGGRAFESGEPNHNLQPEDLNDASSRGPDVRPGDGGAREFESGEPNYNLQPEDLNDASSRGPDARPGEGGGREFESGEPNYNLQPEDLNDASSRGTELLDPPIPRQTIYFCGNTIIHRFHINLYGKKYTRLSSPTFDILGELWSLECKCQDQNRKSINLSIYLKRMSVSSSSIFAKFTMAINARTGTEFAVNENGFNFTRRSNVYKCNDLQLWHDSLIFDNAITVTVVFFEVKVPSRSGIYFSRVPGIKTSALSDLPGILILFVLGLILVNLIT